MATATAAEAELKTYWCHECDMSVSLTFPPSPLLCPHCHTHFLELMDSPFSQNDAESPFPSSALFDVVFQDALALLSPRQTLPSKTRALPLISVTPALLSDLDPNGVVLCAVCKDQIALHAEAKQLPCKHLYHADCITPWLDLHASCPLCRFQIEDEEEEDDAVMTEMRRELIARLTELTEGDFYGLRTTLNHIASRHALIEENENRARMSEPREGFARADGESGI
ncbi:E3 ubiquitin-protein ligase RNF181-like [Abrus precatorius]|uniref:RING-type E3 ubiquitin transferase n=1 Tax=Abrus precatorius TaxID=3816 RepID=A0A8B8KBY4_ABRPR|nr:E3 ubiquitin-protein ligase RNF181-like [Abrus precatorius]